MIDFYICGQTIRFASPVIAANSLDFLEAEFHFAGETWDGYSKWAHFRQGETVYDLNLEDDAISADMHLNLSLGAWEVYLTGTLGGSRLTTVPVILTVKESGLIDEPLHQIPQTVAEQIDGKAALALQKAAAVETAAANGDYDGKNFQVLGYYDSLAALEAAVALPGRGDAYGVGEEAPYDIYAYDAVNRQWVNNGSIQGPQGETGASGATFTPHIADNGNLSWTNDKGLENPETTNIIGPQGIQGKRGADGASPFEVAVEEGFTGTEATFNWSLANIAAHASAHAVGGTDPLPEGCISGAMLVNGIVTAEKLAAGAVSKAFTALAAASWSGIEQISGETTVADGSVTVSNSAFKLAVSNTPGTYTFTYTGTAWQRSGLDVSLGNFGVALTGTPAADDTVTVAYQVLPPYTQTVSVAGILAADKPVVDLVPSASFETAEAELEAWGLVYDIQTADGSITLYATDAPETAFNIHMEVHRK